MRIIAPYIFLFFGAGFCTISLANNINDLAAVLTEIRSNPVQGYLRAEQLYKTSKDADVSARLATILAFAPDSVTKVPGYIYAQYSFKNDSNLSKSLKLKMARLAGEGFFNRAKFSVAKSIYLSALKIQDLDEVVAEHLNYQIAWCDLNSKKPKLAVTRLSKWLMKCQRCRLKQEMARDLGKAWSESDVKLLVNLKTDLHQSFFKGIEAGEKRKTEFALDRVTSLLKESQVQKTWLKSILEGEIFKALGACERLTSVGSAPVENWPESSVKKRLRECSREMVNKTGSVASVQHLVNLWKVLPNKESVDFLWFSQILGKSGRKILACRSHIEAGQLPAAIAADVYLNSLKKICGKKKSSLVDKLLRAPELLSSVLKLPKSSLSRLIIDPYWPVSFRMSVWDNAPDELVVTDTIVGELARQTIGVFSKKEYLEFIHKARVRKRKPEGYLILLALRGDSNQSKLFPQFSVEENWNSLDFSEQKEVLSLMLKHGFIMDLLRDWDLWEPRLSSKDGFIELVVDPFMEAKTPLPAEFLSFLKSMSRISKILSELVRLKEGRMPQNVQKVTLIEGKESGLSSDIRTVESTTQSASLINEIVLDPSLGLRKNEELVEIGLRESSHHMKIFTRYKWTYKSLEDLNRKKMRAVLGKFSKELDTFSKTDKKFKSFDRISHLVDHWRKQL